MASWDASPFPSIRRVDTAGDPIIRAKEEEATENPHTVETVGCPAAPMIPPILQTEPPALGSLGP